MNVTKMDKYLIKKTTLKTFDTDQATCTLETVDTDQVACTLETPDSDQATCTLKNVDTDQVACTLETFNSDQEATCTLETLNNFNIDLFDHEETVVDINKEESLTSKDTSKKCIKKYYKQKCKQEYIKIFAPWLISTGKNEPFCNACKLILCGGINHIQRHSLTFKHQQRMKTLQTQPKITNILETPSRKILNQQVKQAEILLLMFVAEHNLPFLLLDHMSNFLKVVCPDSDVAKNLQIGRKKGTYLCKTVIAEEQKSLMKSDLDINFFSIIIDETTDVSSKSSLVIVVRYFKGQKVQERFLGLIEVENKTSDGLFNSIIKFLDGNKLNKNNLIGFAADNTNVMMGDKSGLKAKFRQHFPNIFIFGCICHSFSLCASAACEKLPSSVEQLARDIYNYFKHSSKRLGHLKECQIFLNIKPHRILKLSQTRWLSLQAVVDRIVEQYDALIMFFTNESFHNRNDCNNPDDILKALKNPIFKIYFMFLSYVLHLVNTLNLEFQSTTLKLHRLLDHTSSIYRTIARNFIISTKIFDNVSKIEINNPHIYLPLERVYLGPKCEMFVMEKCISLDDLKNVRKRCLSFYLELLKQIKSRVPFDDPLLRDLEVMNPINVFNGKYVTLIPLLKRFPNLTENYELVETEFRILQNCKHLQQKSNDVVLEFWNYVFNLKSELNELMFPNLKKFITGLMSLPHSSACAERVFSQLFLIKSKTRNRLTIPSCEALLHTKEMINESYCYNFKPSLSLLSRKLKNNEAEPESEEDLTF